MAFTFRDYKLEYEKLRQEKLAEEKKAAAECLEKIKETKTVGAEVPMASFITEISTGRDLSDIYLKHPANESSEEEDGHEDEYIDEDQKEEQNFKSFVSEHRTKTEKKIKLASVQEKS